MASVLSGFSSIVKKEDPDDPIFSPYNEEIKTVLKDYLLKEFEHNTNHYTDREIEIMEKDLFDKTIKESIIKNKNNLINYLSNQELNLKHNILVEKLFNENINSEMRIKENILDEIPLVRAPPNYDENYNVFFIQSGELYEFQTTEKKLVRKNLANVSNVNAREYIYQELQKEYDNFKYESDITIFDMEEPAQPEDLNLKNDGLLVVFIITILFITNYMLCNPESIYVNNSILKH